MRERSGENFASSISCPPSRRVFGRAPEEPGRLDDEHRRPVANAIPAKIPHARAVRPTPDQPTVSRRSACPLDRSWFPRLTDAVISVAALGRGLDPRHESALPTAPADRDAISSDGREDRAGDGDHQGARGSSLRPMLRRSCAAGSGIRTTRVPIGDLRCGR